MKEIKFRAWDKERKKMEYKDWYDLARYGWIQHEYWNDFIFMQYTDLKDKKGKEIYEGDIIKINYLKDSTSKYIVRFGDYDFEPYWEQFYGYYLQEGKRTIPLDYYHTRNIQNKKGLEVIGNIYENPELLKEK